MRVTDPTAVDLDLRLWAKQAIRQRTRDRRRRLLNLWLTPVCALVVLLVIRWMLTK